MCSPCPNTLPALARAQPGELGWEYGWCTSVHPSLTSDPVLGFGTHHCASFLEASLLNCWSLSSQTRNDEMLVTVESSPLTVPAVQLKGFPSGPLGGSVVGHLPLAQVMILGSWDRVPHQAPCMEPASPSAYVSASFSVTCMNT